MSTFTIGVICTPNVPLATWTLNGKPHADMFTVNPGDTLVFSFQDPQGKPLSGVTECVLTSGPMQGQNGQTPFSAPTPVNLTGSSTSLTVAQAGGRWGFAISLVNRQKDNTSAFYFLPDPELQVGSTRQD